MSAVKMCIKTKSDNITCDSATPAFTNFVTEAKQWLLWPVYLAIKVHVDFQKLH